MKTQKTKTKIVQLFIHCLEIVQHIFNAELILNGH